MSRPTLIYAYDVQNTVRVLLEMLGPRFDWNNRLRDRRKTVTGEVSGPVLMPVAIRRYRGRWRPVYELRAIAEFVMAYRAYDSDAKAGTPPTRITLVSDTADLRMWSVRKLQEAGAATIAKVLSAASTVPPATATGAPALSTPVVPSVALAGP